MHPLVRDLYKRFIVAGESYPLGKHKVREQAKKAFFENRDLTDELEIKKAINKGRWWVKEVVAISKLHKYRSLKKNYGPEA